MNKVCLLYYHACKKYGLRVIEFPAIAGFSFSFAQQVFIFRGCILPLNDSASASIAFNKYCTNRVLREAGLPAPNADCVSKNNPEEMQAALDSLKFPLVLKPTADTSCGLDVTCNIKNKKLLHTLLDDLCEQYECISVEEYQPGLRSYRALVVYNEVIGIVERVPAHVIGDGERNIKELIEIENIKRGQFTDKLPLGKIRIMQETQIIFEELGIDANYIPKLNENIPIRYICNSTYGGSIIGLDIKTICKENRALLQLAAKTLNLNIVGFDFLCVDISIPYNKSRGYIIEANPSPDISIHENVVTGVPTLVSNIIIKKLIQRHFVGYLIHIAHNKRIAFILRLSLFFAISLLGYKYYVLG